MLGIRACERNFWTSFRVKPNDRRLSDFSKLQELISLLRLVSIDYVCNAAKFTVIHASEVIWRI